MKPAFAVALVGVSLGCAWASADVPEALPDSADAGTELRLRDDGMRLGAREPEPAGVPASTQGSGGDEAELAKKLANPVASLISIPFQFNYDDGFGPNEAGRWLLNIQPVIPVTLNEDWNLITRTIVPVVYKDAYFPGDDEEFGLGDILQSFFFSPQQPYHGWILGAGPVINWPSATNSELGAQQWGAGPTIVALRQDDGWTYGILANHVWSFPDDDTNEEIDSTFLQPFLNYTFPTATGITLNTESTFDWVEDQWTVPVNLDVSQVVRVGGLPVQFFVGGRYYVESPPDGPEWGLRFGITILLPR